MGKETNDAKTNTGSPDPIENTQSSAVEKIISSLVGMSYGGAISNLELAIRMLSSIAIIGGAVTKYDDRKDWETNTGYIKSDV